MVVREILRNRELGLAPVGFLDDDPRKRGLRIDGVPVRGNTETDLPRILDEVEPGEVIIAIPSAPGSTRARIVRECRTRGIPVRTLPTLFELLQTRGALARQVREVRVEDVLGREPVHMELERVGRLSERAGRARDRRGRLDRRRAVPADRPRGAPPHRARRPRRGQPVRDPARARGRAPRAALDAGGGARRLQGGGAHAGGDHRASPLDRLPRRRLQARRPDGVQPRRGRPQQRDRHPRGRPRRRPAGGAQVRARLHRQGRRPGDRDGRLQGAGRVRPRGRHRALPRHPLRGRPLRQRARLLRERGPHLPPPDRARGTDHRHRRAHDPVLHDDPRGGPADHPLRFPDRRAADPPPASVPPTAGSGHGGSRPARAPRCSCWTWASPCASSTSPAR